MHFKTVTPQKGLFLLLSAKNAGSIINAFERSRHNSNRKWQKKTAYRVSSRHGVKRPEMREAACRYSQRHAAFHMLFLRDLFKAGDHGLQVTEDRMTRGGEIDMQYQKGKKGKTAQRVQQSHRFKGPVYIEPWPVVVIQIQKACYKLKGKEHELEIEIGEPLKGVQLSIPCLLKWMGKPTEDAACVVTEDLLHERCGGHILPPFTCGEVPEGRKRKQHHQPPCRPVVNVVGLLKAPELPGAMYLKPTYNQQNHQNRLCPVPEPLKSSI